MPCPRVQTHQAISSHCSSFSCCSTSRSCSRLARFVIRLLRSTRGRAVSVGGGGTTHDRGSRDRAAPTPTSPTPTCAEACVGHRQLLQLSHRVPQGHRGLLQLARHLQRHGALRARFGLLFPMGCSHTNRRPKSPHACRQPGCEGASQTPAGTTQHQTTPHLLLGLKSFVRSLPHCIPLLQAAP